MPKVDAKIEAETKLSLTTQVDIKKQTTALIGEKGLALRELEISFATADQNSPSNKAPLVAALLKRTPNLTKFSLNFSGHLWTWNNCLGNELLEVMCGLKDLESFTHESRTSSMTYFGLYTLRKLVSSWPRLRILYISGDMSGDEKQEALLPNLPPTTCGLESVTFERCIPSDFDLLAPMFAGSSQSLRKFEAWTSGHKEMDAVFMNILPAIETIKLGGSSHPSPQFIIEHLAHAPKLTTISIGGEYDHEGNIRRAFATALAQPDSFPALRSLGYPGQDGTYKTGRGRNVREHEYENPGQEELLKAARERNIHVYIASDLEYKVEGARRRAGIIAARRRG